MERAGAATLTAAELRARHDVSGGGEAYTSTVDGGLTVNGGDPLYRYGRTVDLGSSSASQVSVSPHASSGTPTAGIGQLGASGLLGNNIGYRVQHDPVHPASREESTAPAARSSSNGHPATHASSGLTRAVGSSGGDGGSNDSVVWWVAAAGLVALASAVVVVRCGFIFGLLGSPAASCGEDDDGGDEDEDDELAFDATLEGAGHGRGHGRRPRRSRRLAVSGPRYEPVPRRFD